jgi:superfamily II DNA/RNA helicase
MKILRNPEEISLSIGKTADGVTQSMYSVYDTQKEDLVRHILSQKSYEAVIIFCSTKDKVKALFKVLRKGFDVEAFHSDLEQVERENIMSAFKNKAVKILIGTDIISRGIDVVGIQLVINYDTPSDPEDYVHRVGRTARADKEGEAITFVNPKDQHKFVRIEKLIGMAVTQIPLPEGFEKGPEYLGEKVKSGGFSSAGPGGNSKKKKKKKPGQKHSGEKRPEGTSIKPRVDASKAPPTPKSDLPKQEQSGGTVQKPGKYGQRKNVIEP